MTYLVPANLREITLELDQEGKPNRFTWQGKGYQVHEIANEWHIDDSWWLLRQWRKYYLVLTAQKCLFILYQDVLLNTWHVERIYD